ncbi:cysteine dioxygenase [Klebsiella pneumoniae]|uniref:Cysteine dioxygenase n=1 Tax=Klebsiella pneumoniae TaxID=573 RepID=A0A378B016_KLEPN|nr:cysteine dioxygenase [Klebsiella pneumoniae]
MTAPRLEKLRHFIHEVDRLHREHHQTAPLLDAVAQRLAALVRYDDWLPEEYTLPHPHHYQQYLLHADSGERFSIVSFVWGPGQATPIHDHRVWGAIGMLRGAEENQRYQLDTDGIPRALGAATLLEAGQVEKVSADDGDIHRVSKCAGGSRLHQHSCLRRQYRRGEARRVYPGRAAETVYLRLL